MNTVDKRVTGPLTGLCITNILDIKTDIDLSLIYPSQEVWELIREYRTLYVQACSWVIENFFLHNEKHSSKTPGKLLFHFLLDAHLILCSHILVSKS